MSLPPHTPLVFLSSILGIAVAAMAWLMHERRGAKALTLFMLAASTWVLAEGLALVSLGLEAKVFWSQVEFSVSGLVPLAWLVTVFAYTGKETWLTRRRLALLLVEPVIFVALVWTNPVHELVWHDASLATFGTSTLMTQSYGVGLWGHLVYSYGIVLAGAARLLRVIVRTSEFFRDQSTALLAAIAVPVVANALSFFKVLPAGVNLTGVSFVFTGAVIAVALLRQDLLDLGPVARDVGRQELIDDLDDQVLILDDHDRIVDVNPAAADLFECDQRDVVGMALEEALPGLADAVADANGNSAVELELGGTMRHYNVQVSELYRGFGTVTGKLVSLRDVTESHQRQQVLDVLYRLLRHNLRNDMNVIRGNASLVKRQLPPDDLRRERLQRIDETVDKVIERSDKVGRLAHALEADASGTLDLGEHLPKVAEGVSLNHPQADVDVVIPETLVVEGGPELAIAFEELLTNAVLHTESDDPTVRVTADRDSREELVEILVADEGPGISEHERTAIQEEQETPLKHSSGVGLWLVNWVVEKYGGRLDFEVDDGTTVVVGLPEASDRAERPAAPDGA